MATMPKEYWQTYERKSPHVSGEHTKPRLGIRCDWGVIDAAAKALEFPSGSGLVMELARLAHESPSKFSKLVKQIETGSFMRTKIGLRSVRCDEWERPGVADAVRAALFRISYAEEPKDA